MEILDTEAVQRKLLFLKQKAWTASAKALKLLAYRTKHKIASKYILKLRDQKGIINSDSKAILNKTFYSELYTSWNPDTANIHQFLKRCNIPKIKELHRVLLEKEFTAEELLNTIRNLKLNKSPGPDGFTGEYYKKFANILVTLLTKACNSVKQIGVLPPSWKQANVIVIPKSGRDPVSPISYRPSSLLHVELNFFTSTLAHRLNQFIRDYFSRSIRIYSWQRHKRQHY